MTSPPLTPVNRVTPGGIRLRLHFLLLVSIFILSIPLINPLVHGDGVGYYAYLRAPLIQHNLRFEEDWRHANTSFAESRLDPEGQLHSDQYTTTGHVSNLFTVGPAILWTPFFLLAQFAVLAANSVGAQIPPDGFSFPYRFLVAFGTAFYGFCGLFLSYVLARKFMEPFYALLATLGIWAGSSLPVYMYFNPFWSHAHSAFIVALFLWYWDRTRPNRTLGQWLLLGLISGLLVDVYFVNGVFLIIPLLESLQGYVQHLRSKDLFAVRHELEMNIAYLAFFGIAISPTLITRKIIFGGILRFGSYSVLPWNWRAPFWGSVLFSSDHGALSWTPILAFAFLGLVLPFTDGNRIKTYFTVATVAFYYVISSYPYWDGMASYGNRFFISLTPVFVVGLGLLLQQIAKLFRFTGLGHCAQGLVVALFAVWNLGFIFQWGTHLVPARGAISWNSMVHNQFVEDPIRITRTLEVYFRHRGEMMQQIEREDVEQQKLEDQRGKQGIP